MMTQIAKHDAAVLAFDRQHVEGRLGVCNQRRAQHRAQTYDSGLSAERSVARRYLRAGCKFCDHRWRGQSGEIDIVFAEGDALVFVEVKKARNFDRAARAITARQVHRIFRAAEEYVGRLPNGGMTDMRFDLALVDDIGQVRILPNAFAGF